MAKTKQPKNNNTNQPNQNQSSYNKFINSSLKYGGSTNKGTNNQRIRRSGRGQ